MKVFLTGATGYVGRHVVRDLIKSGYAVVALVRKGSEPKLPEGIAGSITVVHGDVRNPESYRDALQSCNAIINLPGLLREFPKRGITFEGVHFLGTKFLVDEAQKSGITRFIQMSALGVRKEQVQNTRRRNLEQRNISSRVDCNGLYFVHRLCSGTKKKGLQIL